MELSSACILVLSAVPTFLYAYFKYSFGYFKSRGIPYDEPTIPYGNARGVGTTIHPGLFIKKFYDKYKPIGAKLCGVYFTTSRAVVALDINLVKNIFVKDFSNFNERGLYYNEKDDPLSANLLTLDGDTWKKLRNKLTPNFTSSKVKNMLPTVIEKVERLRDCLLDEVRQHEELDIKDFCARWTTDVIGTCAFGIECNSLTDPNAEFMNYGRKIFAKPRHGPLLMSFLDDYKTIGRALHFKKYADDVTEFFMRVVRDMVEYREKNNVSRSDFMDMLIKLKNEKPSDDPITFNEMAAVAFSIFVGGFETSSTTLTFCLYELSLNQEVQTKARKIIQEAFKKYNGQLTHDMLMDVPYIDQILYETWRKYPVQVNLNRMANKDYQIPDTKIIIEKGTMVLIPVYSIHHDPEYYPNPEKFDPNRFSNEEQKKRDPMTFLGFGEGPRNCVGLRFGMMQVRLGLITLLNTFEFSIGEKTQPPKFNLRATTLMNEGKMYLKLKPLNL